MRRCQNAAYTAAARILHTTADVASPSVEREVHGAGSLASLLSSQARCLSSPEALCCLANDLGPPGTNMDRMALV